MGRIPKVDKERALEEKKVRIGEEAGGEFSSHYLPPMEPGESTQTANRNYGSPQELHHSLR